MKLSLKKCLSTATCALLGVTTQANANVLSDWNFDTALMYYGEVNRVQAEEGILNASKDFNNGKILNFGFVIDSLTGASANGAVAQPTAQTFTTASGKIQKPSKQTDIPLDGSFKDTRAQASVQWTQPVFQNNTLSIGSHFSKETDYLSVGANANWAIDFNQKNTTLSLGVASSYDQVKPLGGIHDPLTLKFTNIAPTNFGGYEDGEGDGIDYNDSQVIPADGGIIAASDNKTNNDLLLGLTQVINKRMLVQFNYSYTAVSGYMNDPYKILSVINNNGVTQEYRYENRPSNRTKQAFFIQSKYHFSNGVMGLSYRYMSDDWKIKSSTLDFHYHQNLIHGFYIEPHIRFYTQTAADFYQPFLNNNDAVPQFASADYRLGALDSYTVGIKVGTPKKNGQSMAFRLEYYMQNAKNSGFAIPGILADEPVFQGINAVVAQISYTF